MSTPAVLWEHSCGTFTRLRTCIEPATLSTDDEAPEVLPHPWLDLVHEVGLLTIESAGRSRLRPWSRATSKDADSAGCSTMLLYNL